ncbi:phosphate ABC transporter permease subunit PstC [Hymenobacter canadensis]|uniref:Phosphate transport system permease protein n=1 Tax=Hymenobacter canadensis TaxID=2999067 RepID=A0ABY7LWD1_9BACT|nr:phosphate ABC transporter permease subunit PstC [Hymenobacter canadensis]WBA43914.1 phosphate ABC transporter permease subunit PstC [Hymenobacter canadensis]
MKKPRERLIEVLLALSAGLTVLTTGGILWILALETGHFFGQVPLRAFLTDTQWTPLFAEKHFGIWPLVAGTLLTTAVAVALALPLGLTIAVYFTEYASGRFRRAVQPLLEILASVPTVVYGFFALTVVTPGLQALIPGLAGFSALSAGLVMGVMILPIISSLSQDALAAVPQRLREASYALGATRLQTAFRVLVPAAASGITVAVILAVSRAVGETMIVAIAAGQEPRLTANPLVPIETLTTYIVQVSSGDVAYGTLEYNTIFAAGSTLFVLTLLLNNLGYWFRRRHQQQHE